VGFQPATTLKRIKYSHLLINMADPARFELTTSAF
jgi:hypothetical protein